MKLKTQRWDAAEHLETDRDMAAYLEAALEAGDPELVSVTLGDIARAKGLNEISRQTGLARQSLNRVLSPGGKPDFATVLKVIQAMGLKLHASAT